MKLPLPQNVAFFREHYKSEQSCQDNRRPGENGIYSRTDVEKGHRLRHLMHDVWQRRHQTKSESAPIERWTTTPDPDHDERGNGKTGDTVAIEVLRPNVVIAQEVELEQRGKRPDYHRGEKRERPARHPAAPRMRTVPVSWREFHCSGFCSPRGLQSRR